MCINAKLYALLGRLAAGSRNDLDMPETVVLQCLLRKPDRLLAFIVAQVLGFAVAALDKNTCHSALNPDLYVSIPSRVQDCIPARDAGRAP